MSRIGNRKLEIPAGVEVKEENGIVTVKGPKGELTTKLAQGISVKVEGNTLEVSRENDLYKPMHGTLNANIHNMIVGVTEGFQKELEVNGVGYRVQKQGKKLIMNMGFSHPVEFEDRDGVTIEAPNPNSIIVKGIDKEAIGQLCAEIREVRPPEPYKGKGIKYVGEHIIRKEGKMGKK